MNLDKMIRVMAEEHGMIFEQIRNTKGEVEIRRVIRVEGYANPEYMEFTCKGEMECQHFLHGLHYGLTSPRAGGVGA